MSKRLSRPLLAAALILLGACSTAPVVPVNTTEPLFARERMVLDDVDAPLEVYDPWESFNRGVYRFNARLDDYVLTPAVRAYRRVLPNFARQGVTNFFDNLDDIRTFLNQVLQLKAVPAAETAGRFVSNSTVGVAGLFDVASRFGIPKYDEDFGQTLGHYRFGSGPYLMLPLFGPSSLRDGLGRGFDTLALSAIDPLDLQDHTERAPLYYALLVLDTRASIAFQYHQTGSPFEYELVRLLYDTKRKLDVAK